MSSAMSEVSVFKPTNELSEVFGEPALVGLEKREVYDGFLSLIASAIKPTDPIGWLLTKDVTDWSWEIRRERIIKVEIIKYYQKEVVAELIKALAPPGQFKTALYRIFQADADLTLWETDPEARIKIDGALAAKAITPPLSLRRLTCEAPPRSTRSTRGSPPMNGGAIPL